MTKNEFLKLLRRKLCRLSRAEQDRFISDYSEIIDDKIEGGMTEDEAINSLESPEVIAQKIMSEYPTENVAITKMSTTTLVLLIVGFPLWFPLLIAAFSVVLALYIAAWSIVIACIAVEIAFTASSIALTVGSIILLFTNPTSALFAFALALFFAGISSLAFKPILKLVIFLAKMLIVAAGNLKLYFINCIRRLNGIAPLQKQPKEVDDFEDEGKQPFYAMKVWITSLACIVLSGILGCGALAGVDFNFEKLSTVEEPTIIEKTLQTQGASAISIEQISIESETADIEIGVSEDENCYFEYYKTEYESFELKSENGITTLKHIDNRKGLFDFLKLDFFSSKRQVRVLVPKNYEGALNINSATGDIDIKDYINAKSTVSVDVETGYVKLSNVAINALTIKVDTGKIEILNAICTSILVESSTGNASVTSVTCESATLKTSTGDLDLSSIIVYGELNLESSAGKLNLESVACYKLVAVSKTGDVKFNYLDSQNIKITGDTSTIKGSLAGKSDDYRISSRTDTGKNNLALGALNGNKILIVETNTGNIEITFVG